MSRAIGGRGADSVGRAGADLRRAAVTMALGLAAMAPPVATADDPPRGNATPTGASSVPDAGYAESTRTRPVPPISEASPPWRRRTTTRRSPTSPRRSASSIPASPRPTPTAHRAEEARKNEPEKALADCDVALPARPRPGQGPSLSRHALALQEETDRPGHRRPDGGDPPRIPELPRHSVTAAGLGR